MLRQLVPYREYVKRPCITSMSLRAYSKYGQQLIQVHQGCSRAPKPGARTWRNLAARARTAERRKACVWKASGRSLSDYQLAINTGLLWDIVACGFGPLGCPGAFYKVSKASSSGTEECAACDDDK